MILRGACHCGQIEVVFETAMSIADLPLREVRYWFDALPEFPKLHYGHLEYANVERTIAIAKMFGGAGYVAGVESPLYFADLGAPLGERVDRGDASYRLFANGVVAVNDSSEALQIGELTVAPGASVVHVTKR